MSNQPQGVALLSIARRCLFERLLPALPQDRHYEARMVAHAMAIAARELESAAPPESHMDTRIAAFYEETGLGDRHAASEAGLARCIREQAGDPAHARRLYALLLSLTRSKLAISNPKMLCGDHHGQ